MVENFGTFLINFGYLKAIYVVLIMSLDHITLLCLEQHWLESIIHIASEDMGIRVVSSFLRYNF